MDWYIVIKTINGRRYRYRQKTWREGKRVRTRSEYIGPAGDERGHPDLEGAETLPLPFPREPDVGIALTVVLGPAQAEPEVPWDTHRRDAREIQFDSRITSLLNDLGVKWTHNTRGAYYNPKSDAVNIPPLRCFANRAMETATQAYYAVIFHELVHWTLHRSRLDRDHSEYAAEELVAELGAIMLMQHFDLGIGNAGRHARYFQGWHGRCIQKDAALARARRNAAEAVRFILNRGTMEE